MDTSILFEQLVWALRDLDPKEMDKVNTILQQALEDAFDEGNEYGESGLTTY